MASDPSLEEGHYGITGIPAPDGAKYYTNGNEIPYTVGLPQRRELTYWFEDMEDPDSKSDKPLLQKQWTLYILGLEKFKGMEIEKKLSYFQVAGIHGYPETQWDGAPAPKPDPVGDPSKAHPGAQPFGGYCHHNTIAFPTWHRPYMLLFEQCIWDNMKEVIKERKLQPEKEWEAARDSWRLPYWDWGLKQRYPSDHSHQWADFGLPYLLTVPKVPIFLPDRQLHDNPLYAFVNPKIDKETKKPLPMGHESMGKWAIKDDVPFSPKDETLFWSKCSTTSRWGIVGNKDTGQYTGFDGVNDFVKANIALATMSRQQLQQPVQPSIPPRWYRPAFRTKGVWNDPGVAPGSLADSINRMFSSEYNGSWSTFSSTKWYREYQDDVRTGYMSLEYIHNNVHNITGGPSAFPDPDRPANDVVGLGHMCDVPVAAFDPIFWLHHCNIDRLTAMWQALNWDKWFDGTPDPNIKIPLDPANPDAGYWPGPIPDIKPGEDLVPFHSKGSTVEKTEYWTSDKARDWTTLGYVYDDMQAMTEVEGVVELVDGTPKLNKDLYKLVLQFHIHFTYPGTSYEAWNVRQNKQIDNLKFFGNVNEDKAWFEDYVINVIYDRYALKGSSYAIKFYLGGNGDAESAFADDKNYVGQIYSLGGMRTGGEGGEGGCINCQQQNDLQTLSKGQVPLSVPLMQLAADKTVSGINAVKEADAISYIQKHLHYKFVQTGGTIRPASDLPDTDISIWGGIGIAQKTEFGGGTEWTPPVYKTASYSRKLFANKDNDWKLTNTQHFVFFDGSGKSKPLEEYGPDFAEEVSVYLNVQS